jgi:hypothetical protein
MSSVIVLSSRLIPPLPGKKVLWSAHYSVDDTKIVYGDSEEQVRARLGFEFVCLGDQVVSRGYP